MNIVEDIVDIETVDGPMAVLVKHPAADEDIVATIVMFHDGPGIRDATHEFVRELAGVGYRVLVPDLYHRHGRLIGVNPADAKLDPSLRDRQGKMLSSLTDEGYRTDLDATMGAFDLPDRVACLGFCLGARVVVRTMMWYPETFVVGAAWHPSFLVDDQPDSPHLLADVLPGSLYLGFGEEDTIMPVASMQPFIEAVSSRSGKTVIDIHPGAEHGFTWPDSPNHDEAAATRSFAQTDGLFRDVLLG